MVGVGVGRGGPTKVLMSIKTGAGGQKTALKGLEAIHGKSTEMDIDITWEAAFLKHFQLKVDPIRYSIRRGEATAPKHFVAEPIRLWLGEFQKVRQKYVVHVIENHVRRPSGPVVARPATTVTTRTVPSTPNNTLHSRLPSQTPTPKRSNPIVQAIRDRAAPDRSPSATTSGGSAAAPKPKKHADKTDKRQRGKVKFPSPKKRVKREPSPVPSVASNATAPMPPPPPRRPVYSSAAAAASAGSSPQSGSSSGTRNGRGSQNSQNIEDASPPPPPPASNRNQQRRPIQSRFFEDNMLIDDDAQQNAGAARNRVAMDEDEYDVRSQCSQDSQDSQDELVELGIPNEDFKSVFIKKAMDKFSNAQLLKARRAMQDFKNSARWTKFTMTCPLPIAVLRELFDV